MFCIKCKKEIPEGSVFCNWCGARQEKRPHIRRGNGTGSVMKHGDKYLAVVQIYDPKRRTLSRTFEKKKDAVNALASMREELIGSVRLKKRVPTFDALHEEWENTVATKLSKSKLDNYKNAWRRVPPKIRNSEITEVSLLDMQQTVNGLTYYLARDLKGIYSRCYEIAIAQQDAPANLAKFIVLPPLVEKESTPFSAEEVEVMWQHYNAGELGFAPILLMIYTGMMPGELVGIETSMVDLENKRIVGAGIKTKERKTRSIMLPDKVLPIVQRMLEHPRKGKLYGYSMAKLRSTYYASLEQAGIRKLPPYSCRHTTATLLALNEDIAPMLITKAMRHATPMMTERYKHAEEDQVREALNKI